MEPADTDTEQAMPEPMWVVKYTYFGYQELDLQAAFYIRAPNAVLAISRCAEALQVMFTERARSVIVMRSVKRV